MRLVRINQVYSSNSGEIILQRIPGIWDEITIALSNPFFKFEKGDPNLIKNEVYSRLNKLCWADSVKIEPSNLTINFIKKRVGFCLQLGNVARTYADLLKLQVVFERGLIDVGIIAVPDKYASKRLGSNHAQYERLKEELKLFQNIINAPIIIIGLSE